MWRNFYLLLVQVLLALVLAACSPPATPAQTPAATTAPPTEAALPLPPTPTQVSPTETAVAVSPVSTSVPTAMESQAQLVEEVTAVPVVALSNFSPVSCCMGRPVQAGSYRLPVWLELQLSVEVGNGWRVMNEEQAKLFALVRGQNSLNNPSEWMALMNASSAGSAEGLMAQFLEEPTLVPLGEPTVADLAGYTGWQQDFAVLPNPDYPGNADNDIPAGVQFIEVVEQFFTPGFSWTSSSPEAQLRLIVVNVGDALLFVYLEAPPDAFATLVADAQQMLQTLEMLEP